MKTTGAILFNPINIVHDRSVSALRAFLAGRPVRCLYNTSFPWFAGRKALCPDAVYYAGGKVPPGAFDGISCVALFIAQPVAAHCYLVQEAAERRIPVVALEETHQMMLEQKLVNNYFLPVDHLFAASEYERRAYLELGIDAARVETTGCALRYRQSSPRGQADRAALRRGFGLDEGKKVAVLAIRYVTPYGETAEVRRRIIECVYRGLPAGYQLLVKPHPGEQDTTVADLIRSAAPGARIADGTTPIDTILEVADCLFDRGNSQVVVDALQKGVPVCAVPMGRQTFLHGVVDGVVVDRSDDVARALALIEREGMELYTHVMRDHLSITPGQAAAGSMRRLAEIADGGMQAGGAGTLVRVALFWAWMGYARQGREALRKAAGMEDADAGAIDAAGALIGMKACRTDIDRLRAFRVPAHLAWVIRSLRIKQLYLRRMKADPAELRDLGDFPPAMNRSRFLPYAGMLYWVYRDAGLTGEAARLRQAFAGEAEFAAAVRPGYWRSRLSYTAKTSLRSIALSVQGMGAR